MNVATVTPAAPPRPLVAAHPVTTLVGLLDQLRDLLTLMPASIYRARPARRVSGSVGEHVRHCLDHVAALAACAQDEELTYDHRVRGTSLETEPETALSEIERLVWQINRLDGLPLNASIRLSAMLDTQGWAMVSKSTLAREMAFVVQHTIHHFATMALLLDWQGYPVPAGFGVAPATVRARHAARPAALAERE